MRIFLIAAVNFRYVLARDGKIPWRLREDMAFFKRQTMGHTLIMGRKTYDSIGSPLPGRHTIVLTRADQGPEGCAAAHTCSEALKAAGSADVVYVCGGGDIYRMFLPMADRVYLTLVHDCSEGDVYFPNLKLMDWTEDTLLRQEADARNSHAFTLLQLDRKRS